MFFSGVILVKNKKNYEGKPKLMFHRKTRLFDISVYYRRVVESVEFCTQWTSQISISYATMRFSEECVTLCSPPLVTQNHPMLSFGSCKSINDLNNYPKPPSSLSSLTNNFSSIAFIKFDRNHTTHTILNSIQLPLCRVSGKIIGSDSSILI